MFWYLVRATLSGALVYSPLALIGWTILFVGITLRAYSKERFRTRELLLLLPFLFTLTLIVYGSLYNLDGHEPHSPWRERVVWAVLLIQLVTSGFTVWMLRGLRCAAICFLLFGLHVSAIVGLEAAMSVTNRWL